MATENIPLCFDVPRSLKVQLDAHKERTGVPNAFVIRQALAQYLDRQQKQQQEMQQKEAA